MFAVQVEIVLKTTSHHSYKVLLTTPTASSLSEEVFGSQAIKLQTLLCTIYCDKIKVSLLGVGIQIETIGTGILNWGLNEYLDVFGNDTLEATASIKTILIVFRL
jgi:hypothetical protein